MAQFARANLPTLKKTASYYVMHIVVAAAVAYAVTGSLVMAVTLSFVEPTVQAFAFFIHECSSCAGESMYTWTEMPDPRALAALLCHHCAEPISETAGETQGADPTE